MTDGQPEPFRMSTGGDDPDASADEQSDDVLDDDGGESIADLIDEASRTAAEQAVQAATGTAPPDRSAEVWGRSVDEEDLDDVWSAAAERHSGRHVFDSFLGDDDEAWAQATGRRPSAAADPARTTGGTADDEPGVFLFAIDEPDDEDDEDDAQPDAEVGGGTDGDPQSPERAATTRDDDQADAIWGGPTAADVDDATTGPDDDDSWGTSIEHDDAETVWDAATTDEEEPDPFRFAAGAPSTAPAEVPDHIAVDDEPEPATFAFAVDAETDDEPVTATGDGHPNDESSEPAPSGSVDVPDGSDDEIWRSGSVDTGDDDEFGDEVAADVASDVTDDGGTTDESVLAESATPRSDAGWQDLDDERASWSLPDVPRGDGPGGGDEPERFTVSLDAPAGQPDGEPDDLPDDQPRPTDTGATATAASDDLQDALEDLVDDSGGPASGDDAAPDPALGRLDDLDDAMSGLDQFDDLGTPPVGGPTAATPPPTADQPVPQGLDDAAPQPGAGTPVQDLPPPTDDAAAGDEDDTDDEDAPPPPAPPPGLTFSSSSTPKKRGLFGR